MPLIGPDRAPGIGLQNLTKMPVRLDAATLTFAAAAGTQPCTLLGAPVDMDRQQSRSCASRVERSSGLPARAGWSANQA